jgi:glycosyltransferase involved in cell wall biosynthesis
MRFGIDISSIPYGTGVSRYTNNLVRAMLPLVGDDQLIAYGSSLRQYFKLKEFCTFNRLIDYSLNRYPPVFTSLLFNSLHLPINWFTGQLDVFHAWDWQIPSVPTGKLVSTVHDLALFKFPHNAHPQIASQHKNTLKYLKQHADGVIAVSQTTKNDLISLLDFDPNKIIVIPEALPIESQISITDPDLDEVKQKFSITKPYFLIVGTLEKRKNIQNQYQAWLHYRKDFDLVVAGNPLDVILAPVPGLHLTGFVESKELAALYQGAAVLLYVSNYEGFGLPILEAFYHQIPVVTTNTSAMPEVAGDAAVYAEAQSPESIIMNLGLALQTRTNLVKKGLERLKLFSWDSIARQTLSLYRSLK